MAASALRLAALAASVIASAQPAAADALKPDANTASQRGPQIFNAVADAMRKWGTTLHPNGMSLFVATVPEGVMLYHGNNRNETPTELDWLAYAIEHAEIFARSRRGPPRESPDDKEGAHARHGPPGHLHRKDEQVPFLWWGAEPADEEPAEPSQGWLHVYRTTRALPFLLVDGLSGNKYDSGVLDTQDYLLRGKRDNGAGKPGDGGRPGIPGERQRAAELCGLCAEWGLQGIIRTETPGFEIIKCDFSDGLEQIQSLPRVDEDRRGPGRGPPRDGPGGSPPEDGPGGKPPGDGPGGSPPEDGPGGKPPGDGPGGKPPRDGPGRGPPGGGPGRSRPGRGPPEGAPPGGGPGKGGPWTPPGKNPNPEDRYYEIERSRTAIDFSSMVSAYFFPVNLTNPDASESHLPRLSGTTEAEMATIKAYLSTVVKDRRDVAISLTNWRDIADLVINRYAYDLSTMHTKADTVRELSRNVRFLLRVFIDYSQEAEDIRDAEAEERCATFFIQTVPLVTEADRLIYAAFRAVNAEICGTLFKVQKLLGGDVENETAALEEAKYRLQALQDYLDWAVLK